MRARDLGVREFATLIGLDHSLLSRYLNGRQSPSRTNVRRIAAGLGVPQGDIEGLLPDSAFTVPPQENGTTMTSIAQTLAEIRSILTERAQAITMTPTLPSPSTAGSRTTHTDFIPVVPSFATTNHQFRAVEVRGSCLEPSGVLEGYLAIVNLDARARHGDLVLAQREDEMLIKRLEVDGRSLWLTADQHWDPLLVADGVRVLGVVESFQFPASAARR